ncbi:MAG: CcmD family protein [Bacillota bacterium]
MNYLSAAYIIFWVLIFFYIYKVRKTNQELNEKIEILEEKIKELEQNN